jgi:hypothetical protein
MTTKHSSSSKNALQRSRDRAAKRGFPIDIPPPPSSILPFRQDNDPPDVACNAITLQRRHGTFTEAEIAAIDGIGAALATPWHPEINAAFFSRVASLAAGYRCRVSRTLARECAQERLEYSPEDEPGFRG